MWNCWKIKFVRICLVAWILSEWLKTRKKGVLLLWKGDEIRYFILRYFNFIVWVYVRVIYKDLCLSLHKKIWLPIYLKISISDLLNLLQIFISLTKMDLKKLKILQKLYIDGKWMSGVRGKSFEVINPADESVITKVEEATNEDVDIAVKAARKAFDQGPWSRMNPSDRQKCLYRLADLVEKNA